MKDTYLTPVLAGVMLAITFAIAAFGAMDAAEPFPEETLSMNRTAQPQVAEWSGITIP
ncbi:hypothetical protein EI77_01071 [Prosthecobacter fusiformis]|uniref:Uncharacterized protein n=1 Tax=Prosthecobacter fusiformis TaxID=48464 RepID=A0A4R7SRL5_9BACT|nr:hypothetical protein [Prosthecobacter fusiformis]TDU81761.1 hypothetical protein EI77_01071 [Prosthecobacter fusiformis]